MQLLKAKDGFQLSSRPSSQIRDGKRNWDTNKQLMEPEQDRVVRRNQEEVEKDKTNGRAIRYSG